MNKSNRILNRKNSWKKKKNKTDIITGLRNKNKKIDEMGRIAYFNNSFR